MSTASPPNPASQPPEEDFAPVDIRAGSKREEVEMDITPMIDITFLLLIYFIVASTPDKQTAIQLPKADHGLAVSQLTSTLFTVGDGGLDNAPVFNADGKEPSAILSSDLAQQSQQIEEAVKQGFIENKTDVVIKADKSVAYRDVERVIKAASKVEGIQIHLAVLESK